MTIFPVVCGATFLLLPFLTKWSFSKCFLRILNNIMIMIYDIIEESVRQCNIEVTCLAFLQELMLHIVYSFSKFYDQIFIHNHSTFNLLHQPAFSVASFLGCQLSQMHCSPCRNVGLNYLLVQKILDCIWTNCSF